MHYNIILYILIIILLFYLLNKFIILPLENYINYNSDVNNSDYYTCMNSVNSGWCIDPNGMQSCQLGDIRGSYFGDCASWMYNYRCVYGPECNVPIIGIKNPYEINPIGPPSYFKTHYQYYQ